MRQSFRGVPVSTDRLGESSILVRLSRGRHGVGSVFAARHSISMPPAVPVGTRAIRLPYKGLLAVRSDCAQHGHRCRTLHLDHCSNLENRHGSTRPNPRYFAVWDKSHVRSDVSCRPEQICLPKPRIPCVAVGQLMSLGAVIKSSDQTCKTYPSRGRIRHC